jgi:hypothetical protein
LRRRPWQVDEGGDEEVSRQLVWQQAACIVLLVRKKAGVSMIFENFFLM